MSRRQRSRFIGAARYRRWFYRQLREAGWVAQVGSLTQEQRDQRWSPPVTLTIDRDLLSAAMGLPASVIYGEFP